MVLVGLVLVGGPLYWERRSVDSGGVVERRGGIRRGGRGGRGVGAGVGGRVRGVGRVGEGRYSAVVVEG